MLATAIDVEVDQRIDNHTQLTGMKKGCGGRVACLTVVYKLMRSAQKKWRILNASSLLPEVIQGIKFIDRVK